MGRRIRAAWRRDVYKTKPDREQAQWLARSLSEPALEATELTRLVAGTDEPRRVNGARYAEVLGDFARDTWRRVRGRVTAGSVRAMIGRNDIDAARRDKGL